MKSPFVCFTQQDPDEEPTAHTNLETLRWQKNRNKQIERELREDKQRRRSRQMVLLLGTGESGKSTFLKQMRIIHKKMFSKEEISELKDTIYNNIWQGVLYLLHARSSLNIEWDPSADIDQVIGHAEFLENSFKDMRAIHRERQSLRQPLWTEEEFLDLVPKFESIWANAAIKQAFADRSKLITENFSENARYYLNRLKHIAVKDYVPPNEDIVWSRKATESIIEVEFRVNHASMVFVDVGGQTKERRKWFQCFEGMTSVLFLIACNHFDEHYQDRITKEVRNKLTEAMGVFANLINHEAFRRVSIIIFFNKIDLLREKIDAKKSDIRVDFPNFPAKSNPFDLVNVQSFLVDSFVSLIDHSPVAFDGAVGTSPNTLHRRPTMSQQGDHRKRMVYKHFTTAVDRRNMEIVCNAVQDVVLQNNLRRIMMN